MAERLASRLWLLFLCLLAGQEVRAVELADLEWRIQTSLYTQHFDAEPDHVNHQKLLNLEAWRSDNWHAGVALFDNSFGQNSQYLYVGKAWHLASSQRWYWRITAGLLHGYRDPYDTKIPFNGLGIAPAVVPALGYRRGRIFGEVHLLGLSATMLTLGVSFEGW
jgi:hypothetical protein